MFCDEPVIRVYLGSREYDDLEGANAFLDCYHDLAYHVTEGYRMVLETASWFISLDINGATKESKYSLREHPGECLQDNAKVLDPDDEPFTGFETTLFVGERLHTVEKANGVYFLIFDDFTFKVIPYELGAMSHSLRYKNHWSYNFVHGCDRLLKRICDCGGSGEILLDFVGDYVVRCQKCKKSTWANMVLQSAINDWNASVVPCDLSDITIE